MLHSLYASIGAQIKPITWFGVGILFITHNRVGAGAIIMWVPIEFLVTNLGNLYHRANIW